jgi:hypothetical protein
MSGSWGDRFGQWLSPAVMDELNRSHVVVAPEHVLGVGDLLRAWWEHVNKLVSDLSLPANDRDVWGAHDYLSALIIRDKLADGLSQIDFELGRAVSPAVAEVDLIFEGYAEPDTDGCAYRIDGSSPAAGGWWWKRIPKMGPVRDEIERYYGHA